LGPGWERRWTILGYGNDLLMIPRMSGGFLASGVEIFSGLQRGNTPFDNSIRLDIFVASIAIRDVHSRI
jgi:hypothetical protein